MNTKMKKTLIHSALVATYGQSVLISVVTVNNSGRSDYRIQMKARESFNTIFDCEYSEEKVDSIINEYYVNNSDLMLAL